MPAPNNTMRAARFAYPLGLSLMLAPLLELAGRIWPLQWYLVQWRFQTEIAVINAAPVLLIGALIVAVVAWADESVGALKLAGALLITFGIVLLPVLAMIALDGLQVRQMARAELRGPLRNNILLSMVRAMLSSVAAISLGLGAMKVAKALSMEASPKRKQPMSREPESDSPLLVVGGSGE
jgi:hypothetical protein